MLLEENEINRRLGELPGWRYERNVIKKTFRARAFPSAIAFVTMIAALAERADHHPDLSIRYDRVTVDLMTHNAGGVTEKDFDLASGIEKAFTEGF